MRSTWAAVLIILVALFAAAAAPAQVPVSPRTPQQLFDAGMNLISGTEPNRNDVQAVEYFRKSAEQDFAPAQTVMGYLYENGIVVPRDPSRAADWYGKAAQQQDRLAQWVVGRIHLSGSGVLRDRNQAMHWLRASADTGDPFGALLYAEALDEVNASDALRWYQKAAEQGLPLAQGRLGQLLAQGRTGKPDKFEAYVWMLASFENGYSAVQDDLKRLEAELGSNRVQEAKTRARQLRQRTLRSVVGQGCTGWPGELDDLPATPPPKIQPLCR